MQMMMARDRIASLMTAPEGNAFHARRQTGPLLTNFIADCLLPEQ